MLSGIPRAREQDGPGDISLASFTETPPQEEESLREHTKEPDAHSNPVPFLGYQWR